VRSRVLKKWSPSSRENVPFRAGSVSSRSRGSLQTSVASCSFLFLGVLIEYPLHYTVWGL